MFFSFLVRGSFCSVEHTRIGTDIRQQSQWITSPDEGDLLRPCTMRDITPPYIQSDYTYLTGHTAPGYDLMLT